MYDNVNSYTLLHVAAKRDPLEQVQSAKLQALVRRILSPGLRATVAVADRLARLMCSVSRCLQMLG